MTSFDPATFTPSQRGLAAFTAIAAGTALGVTTSGLTSAAATGLAALFTNVLSDEIAEIWSERRQQPQYPHPNEDLNRLVGDAIAQVIFIEAERLPAKAKWLKKLANVATKAYLNICELPYFEQIASDNIPQLFATAAALSERAVPLLSVETWLHFIQQIRSNAKASSDDDVERQLAAALQSGLFSTVREMFKRDYQTQGRAYAALCLDINAKILAQLADLSQQNALTVQIVNDMRQALVSSLDAHLRGLTEEQAAQYRSLVEEARHQTERLDSLLDTSIAIREDVQRLSKTTDTLVTAIRNHSAPSKYTAARNAPVLVLGQKGQVTNDRNELVLVVREFIANVAEGSSPPIVFDIHGELMANRADDYSERIEDASKLGARSSLTLKGILAEIEQTATRSEEQRDKRIRIRRHLAAIERTERRLLDCLSALVSHIFPEACWYPLGEAQLAESICGLALAVFNSGEVFAINGPEGRRKKLDIYRWRAPRFNTAVYLDKQERDEFVDLQGNDVWQLLQLPCEYSVNDLPATTVRNKAIPAIILEVILNQQAITSEFKIADALALDRWYVGLG
jgi:hypothetical protein